MNYSIAWLVGALLLGGTANSAEVPTSADQVHPVLIGGHAPDAHLMTSQGKPVSLKVEILDKPTILIFYRGGWCPYCNRQLGELKQIQSELIKLGYQIVAVSPDRPEGLRATVAKHTLKYALFSDSSLDAAKAFGIAFRVDETTLAKYKNLGIDLEKESGKKHSLLPVPAVFLTDSSGVIQFEYINPDYKTRLRPEILLSAARVFARERRDRSSKPLLGG